MSKISKNPAIEAANVAMMRLQECLNSGSSFVFEAGAGAGKTFSLIESLKYILKDKARQLEQKGHQIACITYTNVAKDEIIDRTDNHPLLFASTIHGFCWEMIKPFQNELRRILPSIGKWEKRLKEKEIKISYQRVGYDELGYPSIDYEIIQLHHNDILTIFSLFLPNPKFWKLLKDRFPIIFIDEYQDTNKELANAFLQTSKNNSNGPLIGFFGDHWQKIYKDGIGEISTDNLERIEKRANFRSVNTIVQFLNQMRSELPQEPKDPSSTGFIRIFHTNSWPGKRRSGGHWSGDLPVDSANFALEKTRDQLKTYDWDFSPEKTKILMLTHNVLASRQGYPQIAGLFSDKKELYTKKEHPYIKFFCDVVEPFARFFEQKKFGMMFSVPGIKRPKIESVRDKQKWIEFLDELITYRNQGSIENVISHLNSFKKFNLPESILNKEKELSKSSKASEDTEKAPNDQKILSLKNIPYNEVISLFNFLENNTPFSTQHGVKGAEFENVLVVLGRGWNLYNFDKYLSWCYEGIPTKQNEIKAFERNRNLFYVACSRPKKRLALLFTLKLSSNSLEILKKWAGKDQIEDLDLT